MTIFGFRGVTLGICEKEFGITINSKILIVGFIKYDFKTKILEVVKPLFYINEKYQLLKEMKKEISLTKNIANLFLIISLISLIKILYNLHIFYIKKEKKTFRF